MLNLDRNPREYPTVWQPVPQRYSPLKCNTKFKKKTFSSTFYSDFYILHNIYQQDPQYFTMISTLYLYQQESRRLYIYCTMYMSLFLISMGVYSNILKAQLALRMGRKKF